MNRILHNWLGQLPSLRKKSAKIGRPKRRNKSSKVCYTVTSAKERRSFGETMIVTNSENAGQDYSWYWQEEQLLHFPPFDDHCHQQPREAVYEEPFGSAIRKNIRTNPWFSKAKGSLRGCKGAKRPSDCLLAKTPHLDESTCSSSGYGSHDSSPDSSVHSPEWHESKSAVDKAVDCHSIDVDEALGLESVESSCEFLAREEELELWQCCQTEQPDENGNFTAESGGGGGEGGQECYPDISQPPTLHIPPPPPTTQSDHSENFSDQNSSSGTDDSRLQMSENEDTQSSCSGDFLTELSAHIEALRVKSEQVRMLIGRAQKERMDRLNEKRSCLEQINQLRRVKLIVRNNFELIL